ncbi:MAG: extracellular solute-binding protein [Eubacteriales bacterium]|nr:extracellular solute-binding protein [Eubacteriales bacterium]
MNMHIKRWKQKWLAVMLALITVTMTILAGCDSPAIDDDIKDRSLTQESAEAAKTTPYGAYPETVYYTLGKMTSNNNSNMPKKDTYEDNAYTRFIKDTINVQNVDAFEVTDSEYDTNVSMAITMNSIPDIMIVQDYDTLTKLVETGMVEDLTESYNQCISDRVKSMYASYGESLMELVTFDGRIMALPETNITDGPNMIWLRKDWMDKLGLSEPKTVADAMAVIKEFVEKDPAGNGAGNTVGLVCDTSLAGECGYSSEYLLDTIFAGFGAYPKQWIYDENGNVVYGSVTDEAKEALSYINSLYREKILDNKFLLRTNANIIELVENGLCGSFFGPWWAPNNPLINAVDKNPEAVWEPYLLATDDTGITSYHSQNPTYKYIVVRKGYEYPEIAAKVISVLFDKIRYECRDNEEFIKYYQLNVEPTARPLSINVDYNNALTTCYQQLSDALSGVMPPSSLNLMERSYYEACVAYLNNSGKTYALGSDSATESAAGRKNAAAGQWAAYMSRIKACSLLNSGNIRMVKSLYFGTTKTMKSEWWKLKEKETQAYLKIVCGEEPIDYFDAFAAEWYNSGGRDITAEVSEAVKKGVE